MEDGAHTEGADAFRSSQDRFSAAQSPMPARPRPVEAGTLARTLAPATRATRLGVLLRRLRRKSGENILTMAERIGAQDLGLEPETLAAFERGCAAPPARFRLSLEAAYALTEEERAAFEQALFIAADPFLLEGAEAVGDETAEEALRMLQAPIEEPFDDAAPAGAALLLRRKPATQTDLAEPSDPFEAVRCAARRLRRLLAGADGRVRGDALTDGIELLLPKPVRVVFAGKELSAALFGASKQGEVSFSGPTSSVSGGEAGYVCLRAGALRSIADGDPLARFALLHELGHRVAGHGETPFFCERMAKDPSLAAAPGFRRRGRKRDRLLLAVGTPHPARTDAKAPPPLRAALFEEAAANLFAMLALSDPEAFSPSVDRLDRWAAHYGVPYPVARSFFKCSPEMFGVGVKSAGAGALSFGKGDFLRRRARAG